MSIDDTTPTAEQDLPPVASAWLDAWNGRDALSSWITGIHQVLDDLAFTIEVGPIIGGPYMVIRWRADGRYAGGLPHTSAEAIGGPVTFYGTDTLRIVDGRIEEYRANADSAWFLQQIGLTHLPSLTTTAQMELPPA